MGIVLAIDGGRNLGLAWDREGSSSPFTNTIRLPKIEGSNQIGWDYAPAFLACKAGIESSLKLINPTIVAVEAPLMPRGDSFKTPEVTVRVLFGIAAIVECMAAEYGARVIEKNVSTVKKHFAGHGRAQKPEIMARCRQLGWVVRNDHEADACALWSLVKAEEDPRWCPGVGTALFSRASA